MYVRFEALLTDVAKVAYCGLDISIAPLDLSPALIKLSLSFGMHVLGSQLCVLPLPPVQSQLLLQCLFLLQRLPHKHALTK